MMKTVFTVLFASVLWCFASAQSVTDMWTPAPTVKPSDFRSDQIRIKASTFYTAALDLDAMKAVLALAPERFTATAAQSEVIVTVPRPDGVLEYFKVLEAPVMHPDLAKKYPMIRTYAGVALGTSGAFIRLDVTQLGFHAMVRTQEGMYFVDPMAWGETGIYMSHWKKDFLSDEVFVCHAESHDESKESDTENLFPPDYGDCQFRTYTLALACTGEYAAFHGGTVPLVMAAMNTTMNRVNGIYETETSVTMVLHPNNDTLVFLNAATDPYSNNDASALLSQNTTTCNARIGSANFDVGHVFSTGGGGLAGLGVICSTSKAAGETGSGSPIGDAFDVDYVAHELGHQFGGNHTFRSSTGSCSGNQNNGTAFEPGSGTTIQAYAGICGAANVQPNSDAYFHAASLNEFANHITGSGNACATIVNTPNNPPTANAGSDYVIPKSTPFLLTGSGTDPDGDVLRYCWEQYDAGSGAPPAATPTSTQTTGPVFRSRSYTTSTQRYCPPLANVVAGTTSTFEILPSVARTMNFRLTTRDIDAIDGGCTGTDLMTITVNGTAGPFVVTAPNTAVSYAGGSSQTVTWDVASTNIAPVSCANVDILLSTDGGVTFPTVILANTPNDGSQSVTIPNSATTTARIMVRSVGNIFYDVSNANFTITGAVSPFIGVAASPSAVTVCNGSSINSAVTVSSGGGFSGAVALTASGVPSGATYSFAPSSVTTAGTSTLTISSTTATPGNYTVTVTGTSGTLNATMAVTLTILSPPAAPTGLSSVNYPLLTWTSVAGATSYVVEVSASNSFGSILETGTPATNSYTVVGTNLNVNTTYYWRVRGISVCGAGSNSTAQTFTTPNNICTTYSASGLPIAISATDSVTINSTVNVTANGIITDVDVLGLTASHTYISDLEIRLFNPTGGSRIVFDNLCSSNDNLSLSLDDEAANTIPCPPTGGGTYQPSQTLSFFDGGNTLGAWTLQIFDYYPEDGGSLTAWSLRVCYTPTASPVTVTTTAQGTSCGMSNGLATASASGGTGPYTYQWSNGSSGATITGLPAGVYTVTATASSGGTATANAIVTSSSGTTYYYDADGDGYGGPESASLCEPEAGFVLNSCDCNDNVASANPSGTEVAGNGIDEDCNGIVDDACANVDSAAVKIVHVSPSSVWLWFPSINGGSTINVQYRVAGTTTWSSTISSATIALQITGLTAATNYEYRIRIKCGATFTSYSGARPFTTRAVNGVCDKPVIGGATPTSTITAKLYWSFAYGASKYSVRYRPTSSTTWTTKLVNPVSGILTPTTTVTGLLPGQAHTFQARALCGTTWTSYSSTSTFVMPNSTVSCGSSFSSPPIEQLIGMPAATTEGIKVTLFPNPVSSELHVLADVDGSFDCQVLDMFGRIVGRQTGLSSGSSINVTHLSAGIYSLRTEMPDGTTTVQHFVKQ